MNIKRGILVVNDQQVTRIALRQILAQEPDLEIVGELDNARDAIMAIEETAPHLVLMDPIMHGVNVIDTIAQIRRRRRRVKLLVFTVHKLENHILASLKAGAHGYVVNDSSAEELLFAIRAVLAGKTYVCSDVARQVIAGYLAGDQPPAVSATWDSFTRRERQVMKLIAEGRSNKFIADTLCISERTAKVHRYNLMVKLGLHNSAALSAYAMSTGPVGERDASYLPANPIIFQDQPAWRQ